MDKRHLLELNKFFFLIWCKFINNKQHWRYYKLILTNNKLTSTSSCFEQFNSTRVLKFKTTSTDAYPSSLSCNHLNVTLNHLNYILLLFIILVIVILVIIYWVHCKELCILYYVILIKLNFNWNQWYRIILKKRNRNNSFTKNKLLRTTLL